MGREFAFRRLDASAANADLLAHADADESSFDAHYLLGRSLLVRAHGLRDDAYVSVVDQARDQFLKAYRLRKLDAANLYFLSFTFPGGGTNINVINAARGAHALAPSVGNYAIQEALLDIDAKQPELAIQALMPLTSSAHNPKRAARVRAAIEAIRAGKDRVEVEHLVNES